MEKLLKIPYAVFNNWHLLQQFLDRRGNPRYELIGDVNLYGREDIIDLGNLEYVNGTLYLTHSSIESLGNLKYVAGDLFLHNTPIQSLGNLVQVDGYLTLHNTPINSLGNLQYVGSYLNLYETPIKSLGNLNYVGDRIVLSSDHQIPPEQLTKFKDQIKYY